ncbi:MAG: hypothetical protein HY908_29705 [Myxococcales bacterium]|nr:hypothetical protein [Myxococcales bacterium]
MMQSPMPYGARPAPTEPVHDNPRLPEDLGLPSLGLVMQLAGWLLNCVWVLALLGLLIGSRGAKGTGAFVIVLLTCIVRSIVGAVAGAKLAQGGPDAPRAARNYAVAAAVQTAIVVVLVMVAGVSLGAGAVVWLVLVSLAWPAVVFGLCSRPTVRALESSGYVVGRDLGLAGAGALMTSLGAIGLLMGIALLTVVLGILDRAGAIGALLLLLTVALLVRSAFHIAAGVRGLRGDSVSAFQSATGRYVGIGFAASGLCLLAFFIIGAIGGRGGAGVASFFLASLYAAALAVWPGVIAKFRVQVGSRAGGEVLPPARDNGLTAIGFVVLGQGALGVAVGLGAFLFEGGATSLLGGMLSGSTSRDLADGGVPAGLSLAVSLVGVVSGIELVRMTPRYQIAGIVYAVAGIVVGLWSGIATFKTLGGSLGGALLSNPLIMLMPAVLAGVSLVVPVVTLALCLRKLPGDAIVKPDVFS